jgi:hypothetical protein
VLKVIIESRFYKGGIKNYFEFYGDFRRNLSKFRNLSKGRRGGFAGMEADFGGMGAKN